MKDGEYCALTAIDDTINQDNSIYASMQPNNLHKKFDTILLFSKKPSSYSLSRYDRLRIYEAYVGFPSDEMSSYQNFTRNMLPRIRDMGYNCVLMMTSHMEHPHYRSMGYPIPNYFAASR